MILTVTLNPAIDHIVRLPEFYTGRLNRAMESYMLPGGKGVNVSIVLKSLGTESRATGFVAGAVGRAYEDLLTESGVEHDFWHLSKGQTRINTKVSAQNETELNDMGPAVSFMDVDHLCDQIKGYGSVEYLILSGNVQGSIRGAYTRILKNMENFVGRAVVDTTGEELMQTLPFRPFLIKPNLSELSELFEKELHRGEEIIECSRELQMQGARNVLVSMGKDGALLLTEMGECLRAFGVEGKPGNTVASGDSMVGGFLAGWMEKNSYEEALRLGAAAGTATAFSFGIATAERIREYYPQIRMEKIF